MRDIGDAMPLLEGEGATVAPKASAPPEVMSGPRFGKSALWTFAAVAMLASSGLGFVHFREKPPAVYGRCGSRFPCRTKATSGPTWCSRPMATSWHSTRQGLKAVYGCETWILSNCACFPAHKTLCPLSGPRTAGFSGLELGVSSKKWMCREGPPQTLCEVPNQVGTGAWNRNGVIIFGGRGRWPHAAGFGGGRRCHGCDSA